MLTVVELALLEHHAATGIMLAAEPAAPPSTGALVIAVASAAVAVVAGRALAALLTGVLVVLSFSLLQLLPL